MGIFDSFNPFTGFGLVDAAVEHVSAKDLQQRGADIDREMFEKSSAHDIDMFNRESEFAKSQMADQFGYNRKLAADQYGYNMSSVYETPGRMVAGLKAAGLNPILAATGGFRTNAPTVGLPSSTALGASAKSNSPSRGSGGQRASSNIALASKYGSLIESEVDLNTAKAEAERAKAESDRQTARKTEFENNKRDFFSFFWEKFAGDIRKFDQAFDEWAKQNKRKLNEFLDKFDQTIEEIKRSFKRSFEGSKRSYEGRTGGRNRRNK